MTCTTRILPIGVVDVVVLSAKEADEYYDGEAFDWHEAVRAATGQDQDYVELVETDAHQTTYTVAYL